jgi:hypothetical protein
MQGIPVSKLQQLVDLVDMALYSVIQYERNQQMFHILLWYVELLRDKWDTDAGVGLDKLQQHLCPNFPKQVLNIIPNKHVIHDCSSIALQKCPGYKFNK